jgi:hypothetical protein
VAYEAMPTSPHTFLHQKLHDTTDMKWSPVTLLKLHGSINWGRPTLSDDKNEDIYQIPVSGGVSMADFAIQTEYGSPFTLHFKPVIIPPVLDKTFWLRNPSFRVIWNMAMEAIDNADRITFIGYSLPTTDFMAEFMCRQGVNLHSTETKILVVDPRASELRERYLDIFGSAPILNISFKDCDFVSYANEYLSKPA